MSIDRRDLLQCLRRRSAPLTSPAAFGRAPQTGAGLLVVFLRGAYDAANIVIPASSDFYYHARPNLAIARPGRNPASRNSGDGAGRRLGPASGADGPLYPFWQRSRSPSCPLPAPTISPRSHFETQDTIELGQPIHGTRDYRRAFWRGLPGRSTGARPSPSPINCR